MRTARLLHFLQLLSVLLLVSGCGRSPRVAGPPAVPASPSQPVASPSQPELDQPALEANVIFQEGQASWYGDPYHGRRAASGEVFDKNKLTAAHRTLAFDTWVRVENQANGRTVDVRINDRGPFVAGRIIDLSEAAARELDMVRSGVAPVQVRVLASSDPARSPEVRLGPDGDAFYVVQLGAFSDEGNAQALVRELASRYTGIYVEPPAPGSSLYRVLIGRALLADARFVQDKLRSEEGIEAIVRQVAD